MDRRLVIKEKWNHIMIPGISQGEGDLADLVEEWIPKWECLHDNHGGLTMIRDTFPVRRYKTSGPLNYPDWSEPPE